MKYFPLILAGLWRKPVRAIFTFSSVAIAFVLFALLSGVNSGFAHMQEVARLDRLFADPRFGGSLPLAYADQIAAVPGVTVVAPRMGLIGYFTKPTDLSAVIMADSRFFATRPELTATPAQTAALDQDRTGIIATKLAANKYHWKVGQRVPFHSNTVTKDGSQAWTFDVLAIIDDADNPGETGYVIGNYNYLDQRRVTGHATVDRYLVRIRDAGQATQISRAIDKLFASSPYPTRTESEKAASQSSAGSLGDISFFTHAVIGGLLFMLLFLTGNTMMQSVRERIPEFAVLKTLGFTDTGVLSLVLAESVLLCIVAGFAGLAITVIASHYLMIAFPDYGVLMHMTWLAFGMGMGFALLTALIAGAMPALRVKRMNVVDALAGR